MQVQPWREMWALVTGASAGIGVALARQLAAEGAHLVLTARRQDRLETLARELSAKHDVKIETVTADLAQPEACEQIFQFTQAKGIAVDVLVNNAGFGSYGEFAKSDLDWMLNMV